MATTWRVAASADDCYTYTYDDVWRITLTSVLVSAGRSSVHYNLVGSGVRFVNIGLARGTTIESAYLTLTTMGTAGLTGTVCRTRISAEDIGDAPVFADDVDVFFDRFNNHTSARVDWDNISPWEYGNSYDSVDISSVIQEIVDRDDWIYGNSIVLFWEDFDERSDTPSSGSTILRTGASYDGSPSAAPELTIGYPALAKPLETHLTPIRLYKTTLEPIHLYEADLKAKLTETYKGTLEAKHNYIATLGARKAVVPTLYEYYNTGDDSYDSIFTTTWDAQTFTPLLAHKITRVNLKLRKAAVGSPETVTVGIRATDDNGHPTGDDLCSGTTDGDVLTTSLAGEWRQITLGGGYDLVADTKYAIVVRAPDAIESGAIEWLTDSSSPAYTRGNNEWSDDSGSTWTTYTAYDMMFEEWGGVIRNIKVTLEATRKYETSLTAGR